MDEFSLIKYIQEQQNLHNKINNTNLTNIQIDIGDDACAIKLPNDNNSELIIATDTLNTGIHFFEDSKAYDIAHKALAVNLSDLAAMGATPAYFTLNLTLLKINKDWIKDFCKGLFTLANLHNVRLVGGDITKSLENKDSENINISSITITTFGFAPKDKALKRSGARPSDLIYISNHVGAPGFIINQLYNKKDINNKAREKLLQKVNTPIPQVQLGKKLIDIASSCIDISDGLCADLYHILNASNLSANIYEDKLIQAMPNELKDAIKLNEIDLNEAIKFMLFGGDDYQLCFCVNPKNINKLNELNKLGNNEYKLLPIGEVICIKKENKSILNLVKANPDNKITIELPNKGHNHFG